MIVYRPLSVGRLEVAAVDVRVRGFRRQLLSVFVEQVRSVTAAQSYLRWHSLDPVALNASGGEDVLSADVADVLDFQRLEHGTHPHEYLVNLQVGASVSVFHQLKATPERAFHKASRLQAFGERQQASDIIIVNRVDELTQRTECRVGVQVRGWCHIIVGADEIHTAASRFSALSLCSQSLHRLRQRAYGGIAHRLADSVHWVVVGYIQRDFPSDNTAFPRCAEECGVDKTHTLTDIEREPVTRHVAHNSAVVCLIVGSLFLDIVDGGGVELLFCIGNHIALRHKFGIEVDKNNLVADTRLQRLVGQLTPVVGVVDKLPPLRVFVHASVWVLHCVVRWVECDVECHSRQQAALEHHLNRFPFEQIFAVEDEAVNLAPIDRDFLDNVSLAVFNRRFTIHEHIGNRSVLLWIDIIEDDRILHDFLGGHLCVCGGICAVRDVHAVALRVILVQVYVVRAFRQHQSVGDYTESDTLASVVLAVVAQIPVRAVDVEPCGEVG